MLKYYLYNCIPGVWLDWTLAVLATSQADADTYVRNHNNGGKRAGVVEPGDGHVKVTAHCGAVTSSASAILAEKMASNAAQA
jgi:hypothetical protein